MEKNLQNVGNGKYKAYYRFMNRNSHETVVFIHGLVSSSSIFRHFLDVLTKNILLIEVRGIVYSKCKKPYLENYVKDLELILDKEKIKGKITIVGYSLGCNIANAFGRKNSNMIKQLILLAPINKTLNEIGRKKFIQILIGGLGVQFFTRWRNFLKKTNDWSKLHICNPFNIKLIKEVFRKFQFTDKAKITIINGKEDPMFDSNDPALKMKNIAIHRLQKLNHFLFINSHSINVLQQNLIPILEE